MAKKVESKKKIELKDSGVIFNEEEHRYFLGDVELSGITGMISRQLFPDKYSGVDEAVLKKAADYGTGVHKSLERFDMDWESDGSVELEDYKKLCTEYGFHHESTEYTVTDGKHWASNIDKVFRENDNTFSLGDIKTWATINPDYIMYATWQLSIYAYLMELQNPKVNIDKLFIIHICNKEKRDGSFNHVAEIVFVNRIASEIVKDLLDADVAGEQFKNPYDIPEEVKNQEDHIRELIQKKVEMEEKEQRTWATGTMKITRKLPSVRSGFNLKKFREDYPDMDYKPYETETKVAGSLMITI